MTESASNSAAFDSQSGAFVAAGTLLVEEHDQSRKMFLIKEGKARVFKSYMGQKVTLAILGAGEVFGELSFFDAQPRSASVEALTDLTVIVVDGALANEQLSKLPDWVWAVFRTVFFRFREMDQKMMVLQSLNEYQKKNFKNDAAGKTVYLELLRYLKALRLLHGKDGNTQPLNSDELFKELDDVLGNRYLGLRTFWKVLLENEFIHFQTAKDDGLIVLNIEVIDRFTEYLRSETEKGRFLILSHTTIALMRRILGAHQTAHQITAAEGALKPSELPCRFRHPLRSP